jgi:hypothetical protein
LWVDAQYAQGRTTAISSGELTALARRYLPGIFESELENVKNEAGRIAMEITQEVAQAPEMKTLEPAVMDNYLETIVKREGSIQLLAVTNTDGFRISQIYSKHGEKSLFRNLLTKNFREKEWFRQVLETGNPYVSHLFFSLYTGRLILTAAVPLKSADGTIRAVIDIDFMFDTLMKLITPNYGNKEHPVVPAQIVPAQQ